MKNKLKKILTKKNWNLVLDGYVYIADRIFDSLSGLVKNTHKSIRDEDFKDVKGSFVFKVTLVGTLLTFIIFMSSCVSKPPPMQGPVGQSSLQAPIKRTEPIFIKRESARIAPRAQGSTTGSIYADSKRPTQFFSDSVPRLPGDFITVTIPEGLQFALPTEKPKEAKKDTKNQTEDEKIAELLRQDPGELSNLRTLGTKPLQQIKMQIVGIDANGQVYVKGNKNYASGASFNSSVTLTARLPLSGISSDKVSASQLTQVEVSAVNNGTPSLYQTASWDPIVSRTLAGYTPDLQNDMSRIQTFENRVSEGQKTLSERFKALRREQGRFKNEQAKYYNQQKRLQEQQQQQAQNGGGAQPPQGTPQPNEAANPAGQPPQAEGQ